jgi:hypothetical protein
MKLAIEIIEREIAQRELAQKHNHLRKGEIQLELESLNKALKKLITVDDNKSDCQHEWIMTADSFDQTCYCKKCGKSS